MTDATILTLAAGAGPLVLALAAYLRAVANSIETRTNSAHIEQLRDMAETNKARVDNLEIGNLADAAAEGKAKGAGGDKK
jgi:hypothetical protein